jgi:imidazolonepropionase
MKLIGPFKQIITMDHLPDRGPVSDNQLQIIPVGGILILDGIIQALGNYHELKNQANHTSLEVLDDEFVAFPGMIDAHTHICWMGSRANDYAMRLAGKTYLEIAAMGGGIWDTVIKTRDASVQELIDITVLHANSLLKKGVTTIEVKSGYGLSVAHELKILKAIKEAAKKTPAELVATCLAAHMLPKDFQGNETSYLDLIASDLLPVLIEEELTKRVDVFIEETAFSMQAAAKYLKQAKKLGFRLIIHGDQFTMGVASLANAVGAISIDHLEAADDKEISILANGNTIPVVLPGASLGLGVPFAPARKLLDAGNSLVISSDWNPGSAPMGNLLMQAAVMGAAQKLTMAETWAAITFRAAQALDLHDRGVLRKGLAADIIAFKTFDYKDVLYNQGQLTPAMIWKKGSAVKITE